MCGVPTKTKEYFEFRIPDGNAEFMLNSYDSKNSKIKCLDLDFVEDYADEGYEGRKGEICDVWKKSLFHYRYIHIRIFPPAE